MTILSVAASSTRQSTLGGHHPKMNTNCKLEPHHRTTDPARVGIGYSVKQAVKHMVRAEHPCFWSKGFLRSLSALRLSSLRTNFQPQRTLAHQQRKKLTCCAGTHCTAERLARDSRSEWYVCTYDWVSRSDNVPLQFPPRTLR